MASDYLSELTPTISVIICTYNRADLLANILPTLEEQTLDKDHYEILIIDNNSNDRTQEVAEKFCQTNYNFFYHFEPQQGLSHARNKGWEEAKGKYIAYTDDDCKIPSEWLATAKNIIDTMEPPIFGGPYFAFYNSPKPNWFKDKYGSSTKGDIARCLDSNEYISGGNIFLNCAIINNFEKFNPKLGVSGKQFRSGEETDLIKRVRNVMGNKAIYYAPQLYVYHLVAPQKMYINYALYRYFNNGLSHYAIFKDDNSFSLIKEIRFLVKTILELFIEIFIKIPWRDREVYPYIENYLYECICPYIERLGRFYAIFTEKLLNQT